MPKSNKSEKPKPTKSEPQKPEKADKSDGAFFQQIVPYIIIVFAIVLAVCFIFTDAAGIVGAGIKTLFSGLISGASYTLPLFMIYHGVMYHADKRKNLLKQKIICSSVTLLLLAVLMHLFVSGADTLSMKKLYFDGVDFKGGGALGGFFGVLMRRGFGVIGTLVIVIAVLFVFVLLMFDKTPRDIITLAAYKIKVAYETRVEDRRIARENKVPAEPKPRRKPRANPVPTEENPPMDVKSSETKKSPDTAKPTVSVYRIKSKRRVAYDEDNEYGDAYVRDDIMDVYEDAQTNFADEPESADGENQGEVEERIYDEVMRRTRERLSESGTAYDGTSVANDEIFASDLYPINAKTASNGGDDDDNLDLRNILDDPDNIALLGRIAEADVTGAYDDDDEVEFDDFASDRIPVEKQRVREPLSSRVPSPVAAAIDNDDDEVIENSEPAEPKYQFPPIELLPKSKSQRDPNIRAEQNEKGAKLVETLRSFKVSTNISHISHGPTITRYELTPEAGTKVRSIANLVDDIALSLATTGVRIEAPVPGKAAVGIEVPNKNAETVFLREMIDCEQFRDAQSKLTASLGQDVAGEPVYLDVAKMPHLLIAGATGMGKSVCINSIIVSLLYKATPDEVKLILIDPKKVELNIYNGIPHLLVPVVSEPKKAAGSLNWAVTEMERRFDLIESVGMRNIKNYNDITKNDPEKEFLPQIVIIIDELADLMMTARDEVEESICRIAQKARAAGMHLIIGTQRPSVDVITGLIKSNIPSRIAFTVASQVDSRTIIDIGGAEKLIGRGDMLYNPVQASKPMRVQGSFVSEQEVEAITDFIRAQVKTPVYSDEVIDQIEKEAAKCGQLGKKSAVASDGADADEEEDAMLRPAIELAVESGKISTSLIQRRLSLGYGRAAKLIDKMEQLGYVSPPEGQKPRTVLITRDELMEMVLRGEDSF